MRKTGNVNGRGWLITDRPRRYGRIAYTNSVIVRIDDEPMVHSFATIADGEAYIRQVLGRL
jgi:hypothetical protein